uniref:NADH-ubiquinone oxidoreductase chain 4L n=1 Tax=Elateroidea sp. 6 KM-2017 TaxID=2219429 RepID=A0A346RGC2_9COLE|nr:NADH dehydrogenase subunit 4L [Elateroidea sp. 6 KM-2017]
MLSFFVFIGLVCFMSGALSFCMKGGHFLMMLLSLEFITLSLYFIFYIYFYMFSCDYYFSMIFISMAVCEGAVGLSVLVSLIYSFGDDFFQSLNILW